MEFNIPTEKTVKLADAERFAIGLRQLFEECNVQSWSMTQTYFYNCGSVGNKVLAEYALGLRESISR